MQVLTLKLSFLKGVEFLHTQKKPFNGKKGNCLLELLRLVLKWNLRFLCNFIILEHTLPFQANCIMSSNR
jgi:hypothetical protein